LQLAGVLVQAAAAAALLGVRSAVEVRLELRLLILEMHLMLLLLPLLEDPLLNHNNILNILYTFLHRRQHLCTIYLLKQVFPRLSLRSPP